MVYSNRKIFLRIDSGREYHFLRKEVLPVIEDVIEGGRFILGPELKIFERRFANICDARYAIGVASGTAALHLSLFALGIKTGDEVITATMSFQASAEAIARCGAKPVFIDVLKNNLSMDPSQLAAAVTRRTKAILVVHLYGIPVDMDAVLRVCKRFHLRLIEDCAQALGATYHGKKVGTFGDAGCFSFMPAKNLGSYGEGGCIVTNNTSLAKRLGQLRNHGRVKKYVYGEVGFSEKLPNLQAAVLNVKLRYLQRWNRRRIALSQLYRRGLNPAKVQVLDIPRNCVPSGYVFIVKVNNRDRLMGRLHQHAIASEIFYPLPLHLQPAFRSLGYWRGTLPVAELAARHIIALPLYPLLRDREVHRVISAVNRYAE